MKQKFLTFALLFLMLFLLTSSQTTARILSIKEGEGEVNNLDAVADENTDSLNELMWLEECENGDKDCFNRRVLAEAHLDYIYTQHHKAP